MWVTYLLFYGVEWLTPELFSMIQCLQQAWISYSNSKFVRADLFCRNIDGNAIKLVEKQQFSAPVNLFIY